MKKFLLHLWPESGVVAQASGEIPEATPVRNGGGYWMALKYEWLGHGRVWLGAGLLMILLAFALDGAVDAGCLQVPHSFGWRVARLVSGYGDWPPVLLGGVALLAALMACRKWAASRLWVLILVAGLLTGLGATLIRTAVGRTRPTAAAAPGFYGPYYQGRWIAGHYEFASFPSGHTAVWAGLAGAAWFRRRRLGIAFLAAGGVVAWSRLALGCHHFSDVTASLVWGLSVGPWAGDWLERLLLPLWARICLRCSAKPALP